MKFAIIAAGEGSRLMQEGISVPKPLVRVGGEALLDRLVRIFLSEGATEIDVIVNALYPELQAHLQQLLSRGLPLRYVVRTTPSSMHSMYELSSLLASEPFVLTTVDTIFRESEFHAYVQEWQRLSASGAADGLMGVTDYIDDEKPLYVRTGAQQQVTAFLDADDHPHYISGGIYGLHPRSLQTLRRCVERGESRMRNFQRALLADGLHLRAWPFTKVLDIDHATDITKAEQFLLS
ncbi:MAG: NTP transferase domain-containing protein [Bacteroidaceae bacterium]|nr:NTP transferase domain-containing protein [Bacteroidaceae bacterium]